MQVIVAVLLLLLAPVMTALAADITPQQHGAKADGTTDDTRAIQAALDAAGVRGDAVLLPAGRYLVAGNLNVPSGVTLKGVWEAPHHNGFGKGTLILATGGKGHEDGPPLIQLNWNSCLKGVTILYPEQNPAEPVPYPWTVAGQGMNPSVIDVTLVNPWQGVDFGSKWNELHLIRNLFGCPLKTGVYINNVTDIGRVENVHFNPHHWFRSESPTPDAADGAHWNTIIKFLNENLVGFRIGKTDWQYMSNCFVIFPKIGYHFVKTEQGPGNVVLTQCGSDICPVSVQVDAVQGHAGISFVNGQFMGTINIGPDNTGPVKLTACGFWTIDETRWQILNEGKGTVTVNGCHFASWAIPKGDTSAAIRALAGSLIVTGCEFAASGKNQIEFGPELESAAVTGNRFRGGMRLIGKAPRGADITIGLNTKR